MSGRWGDLTLKLARVLLACAITAWLVGPVRAADSPQATYYGFATGTGTVYAEIANGRAIVLFNCGSVSAQTNNAYADSWNLSLRRFSSTLTRSQFRIYFQDRVVDTCQSPAQSFGGTFQPVSTREEAVLRSGIDLATVAEYKAYYAQAYGQTFAAVPQQAQASTPPQTGQDAAARLQQLLARFGDDGSKARRAFFGVDIGGGSIYAEIVNDRAVMVRTCSGVTRAWTNHSLEGSWDIVFTSASPHRATLARDRLRLYQVQQNFGCSLGGTFQPVTTRAEALAVAKIDLVAVPEYATFLAQAYGPSLAGAPAQAQAQAQAPVAQAPVATAQPSSQLQLARAEEDNRQREAALKVAEEKRLKDALAKAEQDRAQRETQLKAETDRRISEALANADQERQARELQAKLEEERRTREALAKAEEERRQKEALAKAEESRRQQEAVAKGENERRQKEALARAEEDRRQKEALAKAEEDRRQKAALASAESERTRKESPEVSAMAAEIARLRQQLAKAESGSGAAPGTRKALIIGNDNYKSVTKLQNAVEDARALAEALSNVGYLVSLKTDLSEKDMKAALRIFKGQVNAGDEVAIFYAGHGVQLGSTNYLLPTDVGGDSEEQVRDEAVPLQRILDDMTEKKVKFTLAMIDACRDNPFKTSGRSIGGGTRGLAPTSAATGQMVVFAAGTGQQALDKLGASDRNKNGLFTRVMLQEMKKAGVTIDRIVKTVRTEVARLAQSVGHEQVPAIYDQVLGDFYFVQ